MRASKKILVQFEKNTKNASKALLEYIASPTDGNIHDLRVAIRRLKVTADFFPKRIRKDSSFSQYMEQSWKLFKANTEIRDCDIFLDKLQAYQHESIDSIIVMLEKKRKSGLKKCYCDAIKLKKLKLRIPKNKEISKSQIQSRLTKLIQKRHGKINNLFPIVLKSSKNIEELHLLRKEIKKLRYLIEFLSETEMKRLTEKLRELQTILGEIHDSDMTLDFLHKIKTNNVSAILRDEEEQRAENYERFVTLVKTQHLYPIRLQLSQDLTD